MKKMNYLLGIALLWAVALPVSAQSSNDNEDGVYKVQKHQQKDYVPGQVLFKLKDGQQANVRRAGGVLQSAGISSIDAVLKENGVKEMEQLLPNAKVTGSPHRAKAFNGNTIVERDLTQLYKVTLRGEKIQNTIQLIEQLKALPEVEFAEPNYKLYIMATEDEVSGSIIGTDKGNPYYSQQWGLPQYGINKLWDKTLINKKRPVIAIIDTGVDLTHPDLKDNLWTNTAESEGEKNYDNDGNGFKGDIHGWDFVNNTPNISDKNNHGTHVAGIAAAANNGIGIVGANPQARIMAVCVLNNNGEGDVATVAKGVDYAVANGANVLNLSLGSYANSKTLRQSLERAYQKAVIVAAAGNDGKCINSSHHPKPCYGAAPMFPGAYSFVLGVQATANNGNLASFSNYDDNGPNTADITTADDPDGFNYEMSAPGASILSTIPGGKYAYLSGTSMATPLVAGSISALMMVKNYKSQEVLWGDLLHTKNIAEAYEVANRSSELDIVRVMYRERKELAEDNKDDYIGEGRINAGETIAMYPVIRTTYGTASNIKVYLELADEKDASIIEILTSASNKVDFGQKLDIYEKGVSINPLKLKVASNVENGRRIDMKFVAICDESNASFTSNITLVVDNMREIFGMINKDMTLTANYEWLVSSNVAIPEGITVTIEPGTTIRFNKNTGISNAGSLIVYGTIEKPIIMLPNENGYWSGVNNTTLRYCYLSYVQPQWEGINIYYENCILSNYKGDYLLYPGLHMQNSNLVDSYSYTSWSGYDTNNDIEYSNIANSYGQTKFSPWNSFSASLENAPSNNWINSFNQDYKFGYSSSTPITLNYSNYPYFGTAREDIVRQYIYELGNGNTYSWYDLTNMKREPVKEAHGIVWKICVNGKDAQDEYEDLAPLGVGKHKFEVYFNRPMNKAVAPQISFGVSEPYTQQAVAEDGNWNAEGTIYTAYKTITGKTNSDGINRIYVYGAEDNEYFEIPYEKTRFNIMINAAGSMATGFAAEAGLGRVNLTWNNDNNNFDDAMGFNVYRYEESYWKYTTNWRGEVIDSTLVADTIRVNHEIVDIETTAFTDYDVTPEKTYYYYYKVLSTDLKEYDISNVVAVTPLTATIGDANGSGDVDVADVITTVNYAAGMEPKPFIFEAADMNMDMTIDILDVIGIIQKIINPSSAPVLASIENTAVYTIENGVLYVESPVALAGVQVQLNMAEKKDVMATEDLNGFEQVSTWLSDNDYLFLAYNLNGKTLTAGKHALLKIGDAEISQIRLSDTQGRNITVLAGDGTTGIYAMGSKVQQQGGVFNLKGQKVAGKATDLQKLPKGVYIVNGEKVVK